MGCLGGIAVVSSMSELLEGSLAAGGTDVCKLTDCWMLDAPCTLVTETVSLCLQHSKIERLFALGLMTVSPALSELLLLPTSVRSCWSALAPVQPQSAALHLVSQHLHDNNQQCVYNLLVMVTLALMVPCSHLGRLCKHLLSQSVANAINHLLQICHLALLVLFKA